MKFSKKMVEKRTEQDKYHSEGKNEGARDSGSRAKPTKLQYFDNE